MLQEKVLHSKTLDTIDDLFNKVKISNTMEDAIKNCNLACKLFRKEFGIVINMELSHDPLDTITITQPIINKKGIKGSFERIKSLIRGKVASSSYTSDGKIINDIMKRTNGVNLRDNIEVTVTLALQFSGILKPSEKEGLVFDNYDKLTGRNITAGILHEIGHVFFIENEINRGLKDFRKKSLLTLGILPAVFTLLSLVKQTPLLTAATLKGSGGLNNELDADSLPIKYGYAKEIVENLENIHGTFSKMFKLPKNHSKFKDFITRKETALDLLKAELKDDNNSPEYKRQIQEQISTIEKINLRTNKENNKSTRRNKKMGVGNMLITEENLYTDIHSTISEFDCKYLNSPYGISDVLRGHSENILTTIKLETATARDIKDVATLKEILTNVLMAKRKLEAIINDSNSPREKRGKVQQFVYNLDVIIGKDLKAALNTSLKSLYTDRTQYDY